MSDLHEAAQAFLTRYDELIEAVNGVFGLAAIQGWAWPKDKNWAAELQALRDAVAREP